MDKTHLQMIIARMSYFGLAFKTFSVLALIASFFIHTFYDIFMLCTAIFTFYTLDGYYYLKERFFIFKYKEQDIKSFDIRLKMLEDCYCWKKRYFSYHFYIHVAVFNIIFWCKLIEFLQ